MCLITAALYLLLYLLPVSCCLSSVFSHSGVREIHTQTHRHTGGERKRESVWKTLLRFLQQGLWLYWQWKRERGVDQTKCTKFNLWQTLLRPVQSVCYLLVALSMQGDGDGVIFRHFEVCLSKNLMAPYWVSFRGGWPVEGSVEERESVCVVFPGCVLLHYPHSTLL